MKLIEKRENKRSVSKDILVLYHGNCTDGFGAAWAAWKKLGDKAEYIGVKLDTPPDDSFVGKEIYMLDFVYDEQYLKDFIGRNKKVVAIDHHITNKKTAEMVPDHSYDISHSGAVLSWKYFHPEKKVPKLLEHVEDSDLGKFKLPFTKELWMYVDLFDFDFNVWNKLADDFESPAKCEEYIEMGKLLLKYRNKTVERLISVHALPVIFEGFKAYAVNSRAFHSEIGNVLAEKFPPIGIIWGEENDGRIHVSLRSDGTVDVSEIAAKFGGGGHKKAAGFYIESFSKLPWKKIK
ncbi:MAG: DHHA1 domain-containing protein [Rubrivivax sp.]